MVAKIRGIWSRVSLSLSEGSPQMTRTGTSKNFNQIQKLILRRRQLFSRLLLSSFTCSFPTGVQSLVAFYLVGFSAEKRGIIGITSGVVAGALTVVSVEGVDTPRDDAAVRLRGGAREQAPRACSGCHVLRHGRRTAFEAVKILAF